MNRTATGVVSSLLQQLEASCATCVIHEKNESIGGVDFLNKSLEFQKKMKLAGLEQNQKVVLIGNYTIDWLACYFGLFDMGAVIVPIDIDLDPLVLEHKINQIDPHFILSTHYELILPNTINTQFIDISSKIQGYRCATSTTQESLKDISTMIYSTGSGGYVKLVMLSHESVMDVIEFYIKAVKDNDFRCVMNILPLTAIYPLAIAIATLLCGYTLILGSPNKDILGLMFRRYPVDCIPAVPLFIESIYASIINGIQKKPLLIKQLIMISVFLCGYFRKYLHINLGKLLFKSIHNQLGNSLKAILSGGTKLDKSVLIFLSNLGFSIYEGYGLTELAGIVTFRDIDYPAFGSAGKPVQHVFIKISDPNTQEILIKSKRLFSGYYKDQSATDNSFYDGWFKTGDFGQFDKKGNLTIIGRLKDIIVTSDEKKYLPSQFEEFYKSIEGIQELAICGVPTQDKSGDQIVLFIVKATSFKQELIENEINEHKKEIPKQFYIDKICFVSKIPKNKLGKVCRKPLIDGFLSGTYPP